MEMLLSSLQVCICLVFISSALMKLKDMPAFVELVSEYRVVPKLLSVLYAWAAPFVELVAGGFILLPAFARLGSGLVILLLLSFFYAVAKVISQKRSIDCGCYGKWLESKADAFTLGKIIVLVIFAVIILLFSPVFGSQYDILSIMLGVFLSAFYFLMQMIWNYFQQNNKIFS